ncbi:MAG: carbohydrate-binding domain-containing protein [Oscillospiraceae bacterium]|nr:carbohydrate-binding domain-containing protein [Oscillospiraceae bacterium]
MKHPFLRRALSFALCLVLLGSLLSVIPAISPLVYANMVYNGVSLDFDSYTATLEYSCKTCGSNYYVECDIDDFYNDGPIPIIEADCGDIELNTDYCEMCYLDHVCMECLTPIEECELFCYSCHQCFECETNDYCLHCGQCDNDMCEECVDAGKPFCKECHPDYAECEGCGRCLVALKMTSEVCYNEATHDTHCTTCDAEWICDECGYCFYQREEYFCENCGVCLECAANTGRHCSHCYECFEGGAEECPENEGVCLNCCHEDGNHCSLCDEHIEGVADWCAGGKECGHCLDCAYTEDWICGGCGDCILCSDLEFCEECHLCVDCCAENAADAGCECLEFCVESGDFEDETHMCAQCQDSFSCADEFCELCGLCKECCEDNAAAYDCVCGLCVEDSEFEEHLCPQCEGPTCVRGDLCSDCGLCEECCLENSEAEGCSCGICVESSDFEDPEHRCESCEANFSCNIDFCSTCGLCEDCCTCEPEDVVVHGTPTAPGDIMIQPTDRRRTVTRNTMEARAENLVSFRVRAYDPNGDLRYQWYVRVDGGAAQALTDESYPVYYSSEDLIFVDGAETDTLTVAVPSDACHRAYSYFCEISDGTGNVLSTSDAARLYGRHSYAWQWEDEDGHRMTCVGEGCGETESGGKKPHEIGPWQYEFYATEYYGAKLVRTCNVCGGVGEERRTDPLEANHTAHDYEYIAIFTVNKLGQTVCDAHERRCRCGKRDGGEEKHVWGMWVVTQPATETKTGTKYRDCLLCHYRDNAVIQKQTHEHLWNLHSFGEAFYHGGYNDRSHFQYCGAPDCNATAFVEAHQFSSWSWQTETGTPDLHMRDAYLMRTCEICGYRQVKKVNKEYRALCFVNADKTVQSADRLSGSRRTYKATAKPPAGYEFRYWKNVGEGEIRYAEHEVYFDDGTPVYLSDGSIRKVPYTRYDETIEFTLWHYDEDWNTLPLETIYCLEAYCERIENEFTLYDKVGTPAYELTEGDSVGDNELFRPDAVRGDEAELMDNAHGVIWFESVEEDDYGECTVTLHLDGYDGGSIELNDTGLPCNLNIIVDGDSTITTTRPQGILGCLTGGNVTVSSTTGATLTINVRSGAEDCYGIRTGKAKDCHTDKLTLCGNVTVDVDVTGTSGHSTGAAHGLYSDSWISVEDSASTTVIVSSYAWDVAWDDQKITSAKAVRAGKEFQLNTDGYVWLRAVNVDVENGRRGVGVDAKNTVVEKVGQLDIDYTENARGAFSHAPTYDPQGYIYYNYDNGTTQFLRDGKSISAHAVKHLMLVPGIPVTFETSGDVILNVASVYTNQYGDYLVEPGSHLTFFTAPSAGRYKEGADVNGVALKPSSSDDGVRTRYVIDQITEPVTVHVGDGMLFQPFASQPALTQTDVYFGSEARLSYTMNDVLQVLKSHEQFGGNAVSADPKFALEALENGDYTSGALIQSSQTINQVFLQRWNEALGLFQNTGISFTPAIKSNVSFRDEKSAQALKTVRYRLVVRYDGMDYPSDEFTVHWTDDPNDSTEPMAAAVELYIRDGKNANGGRCFDGGAWVRLDSETEWLVFDVTGSDWVGEAISRADYNWDVTRRHRHLVKFAEFDYHTGTLTLYGDFPTADVDGDGEEESYDFGGEIMAVRVPSDAPGSLVLNVLADTWMEGDYDEFGWDAYYDGDTLVRWKQRFAQTDVIRNDYGGVRVTSSSDAVLELDRSGSMAPQEESRSFACIRAAGDITVDGNVTIWSGIGLNSDSIWWNNYCADRYGLVAGGAVRLRDTAYLSVRLPVSEGRHMIGDAAGIFAAAVDLTDDSVTVLECGADCYRDGETCYALQADAMNVSGSARLSVSGRGDIPTAICVDGDAIWSTEDTITISALGDGAGTNGVEIAGTLYLKAPTTLSLEYRDGTAGAGLVRDGAAAEDDFVRYHTPGTETAPAKTVWHPGVPYAISIETDYGADRNNWERWPNHDLTVRRGNQALLSQTGTPDSLDVCMGDRVSFTAADAYSGYAFTGWVVEDNVKPEDLVINGATVTFTMPDRDVHLHAVYTCSAFLAEPPCFVITDREATEGALYWQVDADVPNLTYVELEYLHTNPDGGAEWRSFFYYEDGAWRGWSLQEDMERRDDPDSDGYIYSGVSRLGLAGQSLLARTLDTDTYKTYRIHAYSGIDFYSQPFTIDFSDGVHVLLSQDRDNPELVIPADYVGTEFILSLGRYIWADSAQASYSLSFRDSSGPIPASACDLRVFENGMLRVIRNGACDPVAACDGELWVEVSFEGCPRSFRIPFNFDGVWDAQLYPLIVSGRKVTSQNKDNVLDDGCVSYDPATKTLTLDNATIDEIYPVRSDGDLSSAGYAIVGAQDLTVKLIGKNEIKVNRTSFCHTQNVTVFNGSIVGIGNAINDAWRPYLTAEDDFRITFTGDGSLDMQIEGVSGDAIHAIGDVTVNSGTLTLRSKHSGISSENGSFTMNGGSLDVDTQELCCVELSDKKARFTVNGGSLSLNGGTDYPVVSMSAVNYQNAEYFQIYDGEVTIQTKSDHWDLCSREMYYTQWKYAVEDRNGGNAWDAVEAPDTLKNLDYVKFVRSYPIWVNGEQFTSDHTTIQCGKGYAFYLADTNTVYLHSASITTGVADWFAGTMAAGIYTEQPVNLYFSGYSKIDLSSQTYVDLYGQPCELYGEETEATRQTYGMYIRNVHELEDSVLGLVGGGSLTIRGVKTGIETAYNVSTTLDGAKLTVSGCGGGISSPLTVRSGTLTIDADDYSVYGILNVEDYDPLYAWGGPMRSAADPIDLAQTEAATENAWGFQYPYFKLSNSESTVVTGVSGSIESEANGQTTISVNASMLPTTGTVEVIVVQYKGGQFKDVKIVELAPEELSSAVKLTFGSDKDAEYRIFALDADLKPLTDAYDIES